MCDIFFMSFLRLSFILRFVVNYLNEFLILKMTFKKKCIDIF